MSVRSSILVSVLLMSSAAAGAQTIRVAVASDFGPTMKKLVAAYEKKSPARFEIITGASGTLFAQIQNGAPFDLFFSADSEYPERLIADSIADRGSLKKYAIGALVVWALRSGPVDPTVETEYLGLTDPRVKHIAIANPAHAPYGRAAVAALKSMGIYEKVQGKLVLGENIAQTAQFVQSGNAEIGLISLSQALNESNLKVGRMMPVFPRLYPPIEQAAVVLSSSSHISQCKGFLDFVTSEEGRRIISKEGFQLP